MGEEVELREPSISDATRRMVILFTDIVGSVSLKRSLGTETYTRRLSEHDRLFREIVGHYEQAEIRKDLGDGFLAKFATAGEAVRAALRFQHALAQSGPADERLHVRIGLNVGDVTEMQETDEGRAKLVGLAADVSARTMSLALPDQILLTRAAFDEARQEVEEHPQVGSEPRPALRWVAHGPYVFAGTDEAMDVFEVGANGLAPLRAPPDGAKARRAVPVGEEELYGWRPAIGSPIPHRPAWILVRRLGQGGFGEVWLARKEGTAQELVFKFCFDAELVRSLKRELALFRLVEKTLGNRPDIARIREVQVEQPPFFLISEFTAGGNLAEWMARRGGASDVPLPVRLDLFAEICDAVAAAHSVGVLHKDLKPANVLVYEDEAGQPHPRLADFGIGALTDPNDLVRHDITVVGFTEVASTGPGSSMTGTRMYAPPETLAQKPFTVQGDVYALGVLLYQLVVGDLERPLGQGWEADVSDPLLQQEIAACVAGRPERRPASAADVARHIRTLDVRRAEREDAAESKRRAARWTRLTRLGIATTVVLAVLLGVSVVLLREESRLHREADQERARADEERGKAVLAQAEAESQAEIARTVNEFLNEDLLGIVDPRNAQGREITVREVFDEASQRVEGRFPDQPAVEAHLRLTLGRVYAGLAQFESAKPHLERALTLRSEHYGASSLETAEVLEVQAGVASLGDDDQDQARSLAERVFAVRTEHLGPDHPLTLRMGGDLGMYEALAGGKVAAGLDNKMMLTMLARVRGRDETPEQVRAEFVRLVFEGERLWLAGRREEMYALTDLVAEPFFKNEVFAERVPWVIASFAVQLQAEGRAVPAEALAHAAVVLGEKRLAPEHPNVMHAISTLGHVLVDAGKPEEALGQFSRVAALLEKVRGPTHDQALRARLSELQIQLDLARWSEAEPVSLALYERLSARGDDAPMEPTEVARALTRIYQELGREDEAARWRRLAQLGVR